MADLAPQLIAAIKGDKGLYPVNGGYVSTVAYRKDTILRDNGSQWRALQLVPPGTPPAEGVYWTKFIDGTPVADAAQVAADRVLSQAAAATATASLDSVSALALLVGGYATAAQISAQSAAAVSGLANLSAAARAFTLDSGVTTSIIYDTTLDDDPEWTGKVSNSLTTEPLNGTTRGSKARLPKVMGIAALGTARQFAIYDLDDPAGPVWKAWSEAAGNLFNTNVVPLVSGISARNGIIEIAVGTAGKIAIDLVLDRAVWFRQAVTPNCGVYQGTLAEGNSAKGYPGTLPPWFDNPSLAILNGTVNHVAMTVLPQTRPNPDRLGMRNPTVAYATAGGVGVIREDGVNVSSAATTNYGRVSFDKNNTLFSTASTANSTIWIHDFPTYLSAAFGYRILTAGTTPATLITTPTGPCIVRSAGNRLAFGAQTTGLSIIGRHATLLGNSSVDYIDDWRNAGRQFGASKLACTESARVVGSIQSTELLTNGSFATDLSGWTNNSGGTGFTPPTWDVGNGGRVALQRIDASNYARLYQVITTVVGQRYQVSPTVSGAACNVFAGTAIGGSDLLSVSSPVGTSKFGFQAKSTTTFITIYASVNAATGYVDDISTKAVIADHSPSANHLSVIGTLNRSAVATGAELAAINGFSTSNYAEAPYNASLDPGSGELSVSCFLVAGGAITRQLTFLHRGDVAGTGPYFRLDTDSAGKPRFTIYDGTTAASVVAPNALPAGPHRIRGVRRLAPARLEMEVDGQIVATAATTGVGSLNNASAVFRLGLTTAGAFPMDAASSGLALFGVSMTAPSIEQMRTAYADEIQMFQANAKCLLQGGAGVQDIAYDPDTDLIYVAKAAGGTDVFQGLVNKGTILSTTSVNKFGNSNLAGAVIGGSGVGKFDGSGGIGSTTNGITPSISGAGPGYVDVKFNGTATASGTFIFALQSAAGGSAAPASPGETWTFSIEQQLVGGSLNGISSQFIRMDRVNSSNTTISSTGAVSAALSGTNARYKMTVTAEASTAKLLPIVGINYINGSAVDITIRIRRPQVEKAADFTAFVDGLTNSDNHKTVSAHDGNVVIATATGADIVMPALALRERLRARRPIAANDPNVSRFNGRITADATPTFVGDPIYVPEGGKVDAIVSVTAAVPGGTATELLTTLLKVRANRDIGAATATVFCSVISGSPSLPDKTTGTMDLTVASMGGGWIGVRATGKAATTIEWLGEQRLTRAA